MVAGKVIRGLTKSQFMKKMRSKLKSQPSKKQTPKKSDKRIEGSGAHSARPPGSIGKTKTADRPRGGTTGPSMSQAQRARGRQVATTAKGEPKTVKAKYDAINKQVHKVMKILLAMGRRTDAKKALRATGVDISLDQYEMIKKKRRK